MVPPGPPPQQNMYSAGPPPQQNMFMAGPPPQQKGFPTLSLIGAVVLLGPGLVTWSFANDEAMSFDSDWVLISLPLLVLGGACLVLALHRLLKVTGLVIGSVLALGGLATVIVLLQRSIDEREEYRRNYEALEATSRFCEGQAAPDPRALPYDPARPGQYPTEVFTKTGGGSFTSSYASDFSTWRPLPASISNVALVACAREVEQVVETCAYSGGATLQRLQVDTDVALFAVNSGQLVFRTTLPGRPPRLCQGSEEFYGSSTSSAIRGEVASTADVANALRPYVFRQ